LHALVLVKPATVIQWYRKGFRLYWRWRSSHPGQPKTPRETRDLMRKNEHRQSFVGRNVSGDKKRSDTGIVS